MYQVNVISLQNKQCGFIYQMRENEAQEETEELAAVMQPEAKSDFRVWA